MSKFSCWGIGGIADAIVEPNSIDELCSLRAFIAQEGLASIVIGDTSNLLFSDKGLHALCIRIGTRMSSFNFYKDYVNVQAGVWAPYFSRKVMLAGLSGAEHICGIPGTLGGLICMNGGSQRKSIGDSVVSITAVDTSGNQFVVDKASCEFGYRTSVFQGNERVIAEARMRFLPAADKGSVRREMLLILNERNKKFPRKQPNCGSVFKSNPAMYEEIGPPGYVIERLGFKGYRIGGALVSARHSNFFVNPALFTKVPNRAL
ncbi:UDP-N-acetylmuramate dehydrogenase [Halomonas sp. 328]|uniref:UDP-N-acetylmuramate dehydrogenase n=1 Tax=Halomonas sp. 328 TaxID=2776704 RepID=UPI001E5589CA|nr:UDP-N-acetylmuramate dehydrogenase [Halomonas sp. 328]